MVGGDVPHVHPLFPGVYKRQHAIVGCDEMILIARGDDGPPSRPHSGINDDNMHGPVGKIGICLRDGERAIQHIESLHRVADIHDLRLRHDIQNDALHGANKMVVAAEVGGQCDDRTGQGSPRGEDEVLPDNRK